MTKKKQLRFLLRSLNQEMEKKKILLLQCHQRIVLVCKLMKIISLADIWERELMQLLDWLTKKVKDKHMLQRSMISQN